jgi:hypothetical protein
MSELCFPPRECPLNPDFMGTAGQAQGWRKGEDRCPASRFTGFKVPLLSKDGNETFWSISLVFFYCGKTYIMQYL